MNRRRLGITNPYKSVEEIMEHLGEIYEDTDQVTKWRREYKALEIKGDTTFKSFYGDFRRLGGSLGYVESQIADNLLDKVPQRLRSI